MVIAARVWLRWDSGRLSVQRILHGVTCRRTSPLLTRARAVVHDDLQVKPGDKVPDVTIDFGFNVRTRSPASRPPRHRFCSPLTQKRSRGSRLHRSTLRSAVPRASAFCSDCRAPSRHADRAFRSRAFQPIRPAVSVCLVAQVDRVSACACARVPGVTLQLRTSSRRPGSRKCWCTASTMAQSWPGGCYQYRCPLPGSIRHTHL